MVCGKTMTVTKTTAQLHTTNSSYLYRTYRTWQPVYTLLHIKPTHLYEHKISLRAKLLFTLHLSCPDLVSCCTVKGSNWEGNEGIPKPCNTQQKQILNSLWQISVQGHASTSTLQVYRPTIHTSLLHYTVVTSVHFSIHAVPLWVDINTQLSAPSLQSGIALKMGCLLYREGRQNFFILTSLQQLQHIVNAFLNFEMGSIKFQCTSALFALQSVECLSVQNLLSYVHHYFQVHGCSSFPDRIRMTSFFTFICSSHK